MISIRYLQFPRNFFYLSRSSLVLAQELHTLRVQFCFCGRKSRNISLYALLGETSYVHSHFHARMRISWANHRIF